MKRDPYPLQWPEGWDRARSRGVPKFIARFAQDRDSVLRQLRMRGAAHVVITSDLPVRQDGLPYANATCSDPGIALWWVEKGKERVMACDRWRTAAQNLRAIDMSLEALRGLDRWGASEMVERAFAGFAALPAAVPAPSSRGWRDVFGLHPDNNPGVVSLQPRELFAIAKTIHRSLIKDAHPDAGGSHDVAAELNAALADAEKELIG